jgi:hypothetical protein
MRANCLPKPAEKKVWQKENAKSKKADVEFVRLIRPAPQAKDASRR